MALETETVIVEFIGDTSGLDSSVDQLTKIGVLSEKQAAQYNKIATAGVNSSRQIIQSNKNLDDSNKTVIKGYDDLSNKLGSIKGLVNDIAEGAAKDLSKQIAKGVTAAVNEIDKAIIQLGNDAIISGSKFTDTENKKHQALQQELSILKELIALSGRTTNPEDAGVLSNKIKQQTASVTALTKELEKVGKVPIGTQANTLISQYRQAKNEAAVLIQTLGRFAPETQKAIDKAALLNKQIEDANRAIQAANPQAKFTAVSQVVQGLAGGFTAMQGALALVGIEGEDVQKTLLKVQAALALSQGLNQVFTLADSFKNLTSVLGLASTGSKLFGDELVNAGEAAAHMGAEVAESGSEIAAEAIKMTASTGSVVKLGKEFGITAKILAFFGIGAKAATVATTATTVSTSAGAGANIAYAGSANIATGSTNRFTAALLANPFTSIIAALALVTAAVYAYSQASDDAAEVQKNINDRRQDNIDSLLEEAKAQNEITNDSILRRKDALESLKASNAPVQEQIQAERDLAQFRLDSATKQAAFLGNEVDSIGLVEAQIQSLSNQYKILVGLETDKDVLEQKKREIELLQQQNEAAKAVKKELLEAKQNNNIVNIDKDKQETQLALTNAKGFIQARIDEAKKGSDTELKARIDLINTERAAKIKEIGNDKARQGEVAVINSTANKQIREENNKHLLGVLSDKKAADEKALTQTIKDSKDELEVKIKLLNDELDIQLASLTISEAEKTKLIAQSARTQSDLRKDFALKEVQQSIDLEKSNAQLRLALSDQFSSEELQAKKDIITADEELQKVNVINSTKTTKEKQAAISLIESTASKARIQLDKEEAKRKLDFETTFANQTIDIENQKLQAVVDNVNAGFVAQKQAQDKINQNQLHQIDNELEENDKLFIQKAITLEDYLIKSNELELKYGAKKAEITKQQADTDKELRQQVADFAIGSIQQIIDFQFEQDRQQAEARTNTQLSNLEKSKQAELDAFDNQGKKLTAAEQKKVDARKKIEDKYNAEQGKIKLEAFKKQQQADITQAEINGLLAITKTLATYGFTPAAGIAIASTILTTAIQVAAIKSKAAPSFAQGVEYIYGPGTGTSDSITANVSKGERVVTAQTNKDYFPALSAIHNRKVKPEVANFLLDGLKMADPLPQKAFVESTTINNGGISFDENKFASAVAKGVARAMNTQSFNDGDDTHSERTELLRRLVDNTSRNSDPRR